MTDGLLWVDSPGYDVDLRCPFPSTNTFDITQLSSSGAGLKVSLYDGTAQLGVTAQACVSFTASTGGSCGTMADSGDTYVGDTELSVDPSEWTTYPSDYLYIYVDIPGEDLYSRTFSRLRGYRAFY